MLGKLFDRSNNNGSIDVKMDESVLEEKASFKMLELIFSSKLDLGSYIISLSLFLSLSLSLSLSIPISINLPYTHVWNTVVTSGPLMA